jgi:hypothetical protein
MGFSHVFEKIRNLMERIVRFFVTEPLTPVVLKLVLKPVIATYEDVFVQLAIWKGTHVRLKISQDVLSMSLGQFGGL